MISDFDPVKLSIGAAMQNTNICNLLISLKDDDFEREQDLDIVNALRSLVQDGSAVDLVILDDKTQGKYTEYLVDAYKHVPQTVTAKGYVEAVKDNANRRRLKKAAMALYKAADDKSRGLDDIVSTATHEISDNGKQITGSLTTTDAISDLMSDFEKSGSPRALFGLPLLDKTIGGMVGGRLYVLGARPATGKSALALSAALNSCTDGTVLICSYEMQASEIMGRIMANMSGVSSRNIAHRLLTVQEHQQLAQFYPQASNMKIRFLKGSNSINNVRTEATELKKNGDLKLIIIDYLQLMSSGRKAENRRVEVGQISGALKAMSMKLNVPILALSQLNRVSEGNPNRQPTMSEMRESGDIEQDADTIILMYKPHEEDEDTDYKVVRLLVDKNRQGDTGIKIDTAFVGNQMKFCSLSEMRER